MTDERKRELENQLNDIVTKLREIVTETGYGYSMMVLPDKHSDNTVYDTHACSFVHESTFTGDGGLISTYGDFTSVFDKEFEEVD